MSFFKTFSQTVESDSVFLSNGNIIVGKLNRYIPNEYLRIQTKSGEFSFGLSDILKVCVHSTNNYINGNEISEKTISDTSNQSSKNEQANELTVNTCKTEKINIYNDNFPVNLFIIQGGADIDALYTLFNVNWRYKIQAIYARRFWKNFALGAGLSKSDYYLPASLFLDARDIKIHKNSYSSHSFDFGISSLGSNPNLYFNLAYNYGFRIHKDIFFNFGVNITQDGNYSGIAGNTTAGIIAGLLF